MEACPIVHACGFGWCGSTVQTVLRADGHSAAGVLRSIYRVFESAIDFENHAALRTDRMVLYEKAAFDMRCYRQPFVPFGILLPRPHRGLKTQANAEKKRHIRDQK